MTVMVMAAVAVKERVCLVARLNLFVTLRKWFHAISKHFFPKKIGCRSKGVSSSWRHVVAIAAGLGRMGLNDLVHGARFALRYRPTTQPESMNQPIKGESVNDSGRWAFSGLGQRPLEITGLEW